MITLASKRYTILPHLGTLDSRYASGGPAAYSLNFDAGAQGGDINAAEDISSTTAIYDAAQAYGGSGKSAKTTITSGATGNGTWGWYYNLATPLSEGDELWYRVRVYFPTGFDFTNDGSERLKFLRVLIKNSSAVGIGHDDIYLETPGGGTPNGLYWYSEATGEAAYNNIPALLALDTWATYEYYIKFGAVAQSNGGNGLVRLWKDGSLVQEITNRKTLNAADDTAQSILLFTYWNGNAPATQSAWVDDYTIYSSKVGVPGSTDSSGNRYIGM